MSAREVVAAAGDAIPPWLRKLVWLMDDAIPIPGTERGVGLDAILGFFFPGLGDSVTGLTTLALIGVAVKKGVPGVVIARMVLQQLLDMGVGSIPIFGDVFDALHRANRRNLELIESHEGGKAEPTLKDRLFVGLAILMATGLVILPFFVAGLLIALIAKLFEG